MIQKNFFFILVFIFISSSFFNLCLSKSFNANKIEEFSGRSYSYYYSIKSIIHDGKVMLYNNLKTISKYIESENQEKKTYDFQFASNSPPIVYYSDSQNSIYCNNKKFIDIYPYKPNSFPNISCDSFVSISSINNDNNSFLLTYKNSDGFYILYFTNSNNVSYKIISKQARHFMGCYLFGIYFCSYNSTYQIHKINFDNFSLEKIQEKKISVDVDTNCRNIGEIQIIEINENRGIICYKSSWKILCCFSIRYDREHSIVRFGNFKKKFELNNIMYFSMQKIKNKFILIGVLEIGSHSDMKFLILNSDCTNNEKEFEIKLKGDDNKIYVKDFQIYNNGDIYLVGYNSINHFFYDTIIPQNKYLFCKNESFTINENELINLENLIQNNERESEITVIENQCLDSFKYKKSEANKGDSGKYSDFSFNSKFKSPCKVIISKKNSDFGNFNSKCKIMFNICIKNCKSCIENQYSESEEEQNCSECNTNYYKVANLNKNNCYQEYEENYVLSEQNNGKQWVQCDLELNECKKKNIIECSCKICNDNYYLDETENENCIIIPEEIQLTIKSIEIKTEINKKIYIDIPSNISKKQSNDINTITPYNISLEIEQNLRDKFQINGQDIELQNNVFQFEYNSSLSFISNQIGFYKIKIKNITSSKEEYNINLNIANIYITVCEENCDCNEINHCLSCKENFIKNVDSNKCVEKCDDKIDEKNNLCYKKCPFYFIENKCIENCPISYLSNTNNECMKLNSNDTLNEIRENLIDAAKSKINYENEENIIQVYYSDEPPIKINNISSINLGECENRLRDEYKIKNEKLIVVKVDTRKENSITNYVQYEIYTENGTKLDLNYCKDTPIIISYPLNPNAINLSTALLMHEKNIDVFNQNDPFFNDLCESYGEKGKDMVLKDRQNTYYQNINLCADDNCIYNGIDYNEMKVDCKCEPKSNIDLESQNEFFENLEKKNDINHLFKNSLLIFNFKILKCFKKIFNFKNLRYNIGFYFGLFINISEIILIVIFFHSGLNPILIQIHYIAKCNNEKRIKNLYLISKNTSVIKVNNENFFSIPSTQREMRKKSNKLQSINFLYHKDLISNLNYNIAKEKDKRTFIKMFWHNFMEQWILLRAIYTISIFELISINLIVFFSYFEITFTTSALFYNESEISKRYSGALNFIDDLIKSIYSCLIGSIILKILKFCTVFYHKLDTIVKEIKDELKLFEFVHKILKCVTIKLNFFFIFNFFIVIFCWIYMTLFCIIYSETQIEWFKRCWISFFISILVNCGISLAIVILRFIGIKCKKKYIYNISLYIKNLM